MELDRLTSDSWLSYMYSEGFLSFFVVFMLFHEDYLIWIWYKRQVVKEQDDHASHARHLLLQFCVPKLLHIPDFLTWWLIGSWFWCGCGTTEKTLGVAWVPSQSCGSSRYPGVFFCAEVQSQCRCRRAWNLSHLFPGCISLNNLRMQLVQNMSMSHVIYISDISIWGFPKMVVPPNHPF